MCTLKKTPKETSRGVRFPTYLLERLTDRAKVSGRSLNWTVVDLIEKAMTIERAGGYVTHLVRRIESGGTVAPWRAPCARQRPPEAGKPTKADFRGTGQRYSGRSRQGT